MKYMLMMSCTRSDFESLAGWTPDEFKAHIEFMIALTRELTATGELVAAEGLDVPMKAKIVRAARADAPMVTDGPFAETKEFLAGFWIVEVPSEARAVAIAAKASTAPGPGGRPLQIPIELRAVGQAPEV
ncbi:MAG: hypothetical protein JNJ88_04010 [Planctomycetes bacterium]|nr:hypothetical protein [Planctomycetota bacterium]